jgi:glycosyltransferase involved in cell wall biosynthesis
MRIDLLMTTRNRHACVERLLNSLEKQTRRNFRLVAGLQCPDATMLALVRRYAAKFPVQSVPLPECGLSAARNRLFPAVSGQIVALTDDDCHYPPPTMAALEDFFRAHPESDACVGVPCLEDAAAPTGTGKIAAVGRFGMFWQAPSWLLFFRHAAMRRVGAFDERLGVGAASPWQSGEETDYALRLLSQGGKIMRVGSVGVAHPCPDFSCANTAKWYAYGMGRMELLRNHQFPRWFCLLNIVHPLARMLREPASHWKCLWAMFAGRFTGAWQGNEGSGARTF